VSRNGADGVARDCRSGDGGDGRIIGGCLGSKLTGRGRASGASGALGPTSGLVALVFAYLSRDAGGVPKLLCLGGGCACRLGSCGGACSLFGRFTFFGGGTAWLARRSGGTA
jgi:hypothetical protein